MITWAKALLNETNPASKYISGTAYHWYHGSMVSAIIFVAIIICHLQGLFVKRELILGFCFVLCS